MMWPTLASLLEERLSDDLEATAVVVHALNEWMHEHWTFNFDDRIFATPVINLSILDEAIRELDYVVERGARAILVRPAPVPGNNGRRRSLALPEFDPFWKRVEESGVLVGMHSSDDGSQRYLNEWEGNTKEFTPFGKQQSAFSLMLQHEWRTIHDVVMSMISHGLVSRFPKIRFMPVENGSAWVRPLVHTLEDQYARTPELFDEDPMVAWRRSIFVHPFHEENVLGLVEVLGAKNVVFGSDYPHPEGMFDPVTFIDELDELPLDEQKSIMGANLASVMGVDPLLKAI
jgi:predicted TIM-barrel fold metal-dependent hydrolase